jgi:hypothetical protein
VPFHTVFVAPAEDELEVRALIDSALRSGSWTVVASGPRDPNVEEQTLGRRIGGSMGQPTVSGVGHRSTAGPSRDGPPDRSDPMAARPQGKTQSAEGKADEREDQDEIDG